MNAHHMRVRWRVCVCICLHYQSIQKGGKGRAGFFGGGGGGVLLTPSSFISAKLTVGSGGLSGGESGPLGLVVVAFCCLAGSGGGRSSPDDEELIVDDATLFCDGEEQTPPSPFSCRLTMDERLSLMASERSGRLAVNCCVNSITTVGDGISVEWPLFTVSDDDDISSEWALEPVIQQE